MLSACPGANRFKQPYPEEIACPKCGAHNEIWTDERAVRCRGCKYRVTRKAGQSCLDWCKYARECMQSWVGKSRADMVE